METLKSIIATFASLAASVALAALWAVGAAAQDRLEFGVVAGGCYYMGEMNPSQQFKDTRPMGGLLARYAYSDRIAFKAVVGLYPIKGEYDGASPDIYSFPHEPSDHTFAEGETEAWRPGETSFENNLIDASVFCEFNFLSFDHFFKKDQTRFSPYLCAGLGVTAYTRYVGDDEKRQIVLTLPFGFGVKYKLNKLVRLGMEWTFHKTFTDRLECVTNPRETFDPADPYRNGVHKLTHNNDWFASLGVSLSLSLWPRSLVCRDGFQKGGRL